MNKNEVYKLPSSLSMCSLLKHLKLSSCSISPPPSFKGLNRLITLELLDVIIDTEVLGSLITSSPELEQLVLHVPAGFHHLTIDAPKLKLVKLKCFRAYVYFKKSPLLAIVSVASLTTICYNSIIHRKYDFIEFFDSLPALQQLCIDYQMMKILAAGQVQTRLPATLVHLKILSLFYICLDSSEDLSYVLFLFRSSPNIEKLKLQILHRPYVDALPEMTLIKLLLEKSPKLDRMVIRLKWPLEKLADKGFGILIKTNKFERASPNAKVIFKALDETELW
ncbi:unnamed protein product [Fraxinus pennsylvanica]|uniref:F-box/LRR-repeat protein 15/At3g58940/PEG3-like LRR domain-containing protein n=1 Tax=Fraxinus pennsylvanica TaxID=56036 RepID=A0AAD1ZBW9_9LAMI|nr:unnamed protein product [Fraxinus pennsylvanica]